MAYSNRNIIITPNIGSSSAEPIIAYQGGGASTSATLFSRVLDLGTLSFEATAGQVQTVGDGMTGNYFYVSDISGIPSITVNSSGLIQLANYQGYVTLGNNTQSTSTGTGALQVLGGVGISGNLNIGGSFSLQANLGVGGSSGNYGLTINTTTNVAELLTYNNSTGLALQVGASTYPLGIGFNSYNNVGTTYVMGNGYNAQLQLGASGGLNFYVSASSQSAGAVATQINTLQVNSTQILVPQSTAATSTSTGAITTYGGISSGGAHYAGADSYFNGLRVGQGNLASTPSNTVIGASAGASLISGGTSNTLIGYNSGNGVTSGGNNTFIGYNTGAILGAGSSNTGIGTSALASAAGSSAQNNTAIGYRALGSGSLVTGGNTAVGTNALLLMASGQNNTAVGYGAGSTISGNNNGVFIGYNAGNAVGYDNCVIIGNNSGGSLSAAGQIIIANGAGTQRLFIDGSGNVTVSATTAASATSGVGSLIVSGGASIASGLNLGGALYANNSAGTNGYYLQTTGSGIQWAQAGITISNITTAGTYYPTFTNSVSGNLTTLDVDSVSLVFNPGSGAAGAVLSMTGSTSGGTGNGAFYTGFLGVGVSTSNAVNNGTVMQIGYLNGSNNLLRIGDGSSGQTGYRWRVDQTYNWIANSGTGDNFSVSSTNGAVSTPGTITVTASQAGAINLGASGTGNGGDIIIKNSYPTICLQNTAYKTAYLQANSNNFYVLSGTNGSGAGNYAQVNSQWPLYIDLTTNNNYVGGTLYVVGDAYTATSDERLKNIEAPITDAIAKIMTLDGFYYTDNEIATSLGVQGGRRKLGLSAQKLQAVIPEVVVPAPFDRDEHTGESRTGENYLTAQYERIVPLLVEGIKEHERTIQAQQAQIDELKALVQQLMNK
jgi:hypothetical protein